MAVTYKSYDGQLASTTTDIIAATADIEMTVSAILHNTNVGALTCTLYLKKGVGDNRIIFKQSIGTDETAYIEIKAVLETGDALLGDDGGTGSVVDYWVSTVEVS